MKITQEQKDVLDSLQCVRLSSDEAHLRMVDDFSVPMNPNLSDPLQNEAFEDDQDERVAYYIIKHPVSGRILFYFSLKCGMLYDTYVYADAKLLQDFIKFLDETSKDVDATEEERRMVDLIKERLRVHKGVTKEDLEAFKKKNKTLDKLRHRLDKNTKAVGKTFAGVEIVHFVANDNYRDQWKQMGINQKLGVVVFWHFVVPIIQDVMKLIGCQYVFLFAADSSVDETLVNYYRVHLGFDDVTEHNAAMPLYDFTCRFMCQEASGLKQKRNSFYDNFNPDKDAV